MTTKSGTQDTKVLELSESKQAAYLSSGQHKVVKQISLLFLIVFNVLVEAN